MSRVRADQAAGRSIKSTQKVIDLSTSTVTGNLPVTRLAGGASASSATFWRGDGTWAAASGGGGGTVTSVGLALPSIFVVSGSPVTTSGTLTGALDTQTANLVFAGPSTGAAAAPTLRSLVAADIPSVTLAMMDTMATASFLGRNTAATGLVEVLSTATTKTMLGLTGTNSGDQTITLTGGVTGSGTGSFAATVVTNANLTGGVTSVGNAATVVTNANLTGVVTSTGNATAIANGAISNAMLVNGAVANLSGTNTGDQTTITGNAATATALQTARTINTVSFDGTANIVVTAAAGTLTGATLNSTVTASSLTSVGVLVTGTAFAGSTLNTNIAAPATPAAGKNSFFSDSTDKRLHDINEDGTIGTTIVSSAAVSNQFITGVSAAGVISRAQPAFTNISGSVAASQMPAHTGDVTSSAGAVALTIQPNTVTLAKMDTMATASILGRNTAATGNVEVLSASTTKTLLSLNNVENTALSTWAGTANITTLGTLTTGATGAGFTLSLTNSTISGNLPVANLNSGTSASSSTFWRGDGTWSAVAGANGGTVTSVGMTVPSFLSVTGSPITGADTLAVTLATQTANTIFAGPGTGSAAAPTFRSLVANDLGVAAILASANIFTVNGAVSVPATKLNGTWYSGGSATTTKPMFLLEPSGTTSTGWNTNGTAIGVNAASGFTTGSLLDLQIAGASKFKVHDGGYLDAVGIIYSTGVNAAIGTDDQSVAGTTYYMVGGAGVLKFNTSASGYLTQFSITPSGGADTNSTVTCPYNLTVGNNITTGKLNSLIVTTSAGKLTIANNASAELKTTGNFVANLTFTAASTPTFPAGTTTLLAQDGSGVNLTALNATQLTSGTVPDARFPATLPAASAANLTSIPREAYYYARDEKTSGTDGGGFTSGSFVTRTINTEVNDAGAVGSIATNAVTLIAGTYRFLCSAPAYACAAHQVRLANTSDATYYYGTSEQANSANTGSNRSFVSGRFTISASKVFEIQHRCGVTKATNGLGTAGTFGGVEVYATMEFWKE